MKAEEHKKKKKESTRHLSHQSNSFFLSESKRNPDGESVEFKIKVTLVSSWKSEASGIRNSKCSKIGSNEIGIAEGTSDSSCGLEYTIRFLKEKPEERRLSEPRD